MAVNEQVMDLVALLDKEGFSVLAGEILMEIALGRESEFGDGDRAYERIPIPDDEQLREAVNLLKLRLTEPARRLAEAEKIAGGLNGGGIVPIIFIDTNGEPVVKPAPVSAADQARSTEAIDNLEEGLAQLLAPRDGAA
ncbi:hypothetical protein AB9F36_31050 [Rhizobium leguminosarum]|uniref:hypothetical protein n=1 Tax=Rhizobium leguminosarum TaxID=384 RepID=UPI003F94FA7E